MDSVLFSEMNEVLLHTPADSETTAVTSSDVWAGGHHRIVALVSVGDMGTNATFNFKLQQSDDADGTTTKDITGKAITELDESDSDGNQVLIVELRTDELDVSGGFDYVRYVATPATAAVEFSVILLGCDPRYLPVSTTNVEEIVN